MQVVYKIISIIEPSKIYIGSTVRYSVRKSQHIKQLITNTHKNRNLQKHVNTHGIGDLKFEIIIEVDNRDELLKVEQAYIDLLDPFFNIFKQNVKTSLGVVRTMETKLNISKAMRGKKHRPECSIEKSNRQKGQKRRGVKHTEEAKSKISLNSAKKRVVEQYDKSRKFIKEWSSIKEASLGLGISAVGISGAARGIYKESGNFIWKYKKIQK